MSPLSIRSQPVVCSLAGCPADHPCSVDSLSETSDALKNCTRPQKHSALFEMFS
jgi:hypothetical protein